MRSGTYSGRRGAAPAARHARTGRRSAAALGFAATAAAARPWEKRWGLAAAAEEERVLERLASGVEEAGFKEEKQQGLAGEARSSEA